MKTIGCYVLKIKKRQNTLKTQAVYNSLVSKQSKLRKSSKPKDKTPADAAINGSQG